MKTALITGSNRGIGLELVRQLHARGVRVFAACRTASDALRALDVEVIEDVDVADDGVGAHLREVVGDTPLDLLVCNAGVLSGESLESMDWDAIRRQFEVNALGPLRVVHGLVDALPRGARIAIITSRMGSIADNTSGGMYGYRASKAAVNQVGRSLAHDLHDRGVAVQLLHPGYVRTEMTGGNGLIGPEESAAGLLRCIDELTIEDSGSFRHQNGEMLPW